MAAKLGDVRQVRNVAIILALAAAVAFLPAAGVGASFLGWLLGIAFLAALAWFVARMYREYRLTIYGLGDRNRGLLYVADKKYDLALEQWERARELDPDNRLYRSNLRRLRAQVAGRDRPPNNNGD